MTSSREHQESAERRPAPRLFYFRHAQALYDAIRAKLRSENPHGPIDIDQQPDNDLTPEGHELAHSSARNFLSRLNPDKDALYIVSSNQMRALQTALAFVEEAKEQGFQVVLHEKTGSSVAERVGRGYIRSLETLSHGYAEAVSDTVFNPPSQMSEMNWDSIDPEFRRRWEKARQIVLADDKGSWGANFFAYSEQLKTLLPELRSAQQLFESRYKTLERLAALATKRVAGQRMNILAFGHENMMGVPLERDTGNHALPNCEGVEMVNGRLQRVSI